MRFDLRLGTRIKNSMKFLALCGPVLWLIVFASAVALVVFIQRVLHYHRAQINSMEFLNGVRNVLKRDNVVEALSICDATPGPVARLVKTVRDGKHRALDTVCLRQILGGVE